MIWLTFLTFVSHSFLAWFNSIFSISLASKELVIRGAKREDDFGELKFNNGAAGKISGSWMKLSWWGSRNSRSTQVEWNPSSSSTNPVECWMARGESRFSDVFLGIEEIA